MNPEISIIIPVFNEEKIIPELYQRLTKAAQTVSENYELIFVNDGSKDSTLENLKRFSQQDNKIKYISFSRNFGHQIALTAGLQYAKGKAIVIIDGDLQDPPELIPKLYKKYKEGYKVVYAKRTERQGETFLKKITAKLFYRILARIISFEIPLDTGDFRLIDETVVKHLNEMNETNKFLRGQIAWLGFKQTFVEFEREERKHGKTKFSFKKMFSFAMDGITSFSNLPLKLATLLGFLVSIMAFIVILYALYSKFIRHEVITGWTSIIISTMFIGGVQLICIGILGEYISRINNDVRRRPLYIMEESNID